MSDQALMNYWRDTYYRRTQEVFRLRRELEQERQAPSRAGPEGATKQDWVDFCELIKLINRARGK